MNSIDFNQLFAVSPDFLCILNCDAVIQKVNLKWITKLGYKQAELEGISIYDIIHPDDKGETKAIFTLIDSDEQSAEFVNRIKDLNNQYHYFEWRAILINNAIFAIARDISESIEENKQLNTLFSDDYLNSKALNYHRLSDKLLEITKASFVFLNTYHKSTNSFITKAVSGSNTRIEKSEKLLEVKFEGLSWEENCFKFEQYPSLTSFSCEKFNKSSIALIEKIYQTGQVYIFNISDKESLLGNIIIILPNGIALQHLSLINRFINIISSLLSHKDEVSSPKNDFNQLIHNMPNAFAYFDSVFDENDNFVSYRFIYVNESYEKLTDIKLEDVAGKTVQEVWSNIDREWIDRYGKVAVTGIPDAFEMYHKPTGKTFQSYVYRAGNNSDRFCVMFYDITERKNTEISLNETKEKLQNIFRSVNAGIAVVAKNKIIEVNNEICTLTEYSREELVNNTPDILYPDPAAYEKVKKDISKQLNDKGIGIIESEFQKKSGAVISVILTVSIIEFPDKTKGLTFSVVDISRHKQYMDAMLYSKNMESIGTLAGGVAHEYNNMLMIILGYVELSLSMINPDNPVHKNLQEIHRAAHKTSSITRQLLTFARKETINTEVIDLNKVITSHFPDLQKLIPEDIELIWKPSADLKKIEIDPQQIYHILITLISNSKEAIKEKGSIIIETENFTIGDSYCEINPDFEPGDYVRLSVNDTGCGMDKAIQDKIFLPFFTTKEVGNNSGLGLSTLYGIVNQNSGYLNVYSEPGYGTSFNIYFPQALSIDIPASIKTKRTSLEGNETILMIDDEPLILDVILPLIKSFGYTVYVANNSEKAVKVIEENKGNIDLVVADIVLPDLSGIELKQQISKKYPEIEFVYMSGYSKNLLYHRGLVKKNIPFIQKPFLIEDILSIARKILDDKKK